MEFKDYYKIMGVPRDATEPQIKQAYRKLARKFHPDVSKEPDAEARFKEVGEAYEVLKSPDKRAAYDRLGSGPQPGAEFRPPPDWGAGFEFGGPGARRGGARSGAGSWGGGAAPGGGGASAAGGAPGGDAGGGDYSDFFESLFGGRRRGDSPFGGGAGAGFAGGDDGFAPGKDHHARILLDLDASLSGGARTISLRTPELDEQGRLQSKDRVLSVQVPKGILPGQTIRLAGQGAPATAGSPAGDLFIEVEFQPHDLFRVDGRDLYLDLPVAPWEAALGAVVQAPTPTGIVDLKIPAGSHAGTKLRLRERGMPAKPPGDFFVVLSIALPPADAAGAKAAYAAFAAAVPFNPRSSLGV